MRCCDLHWHRSVWVAWINFSIPFLDSRTGSAVPRSTSSYAATLRREKMKSVLCCGLLISWVIPICATAQSPFDGSWKAEPTETDTARTPEVYLLQDGAYRCPTCDPPLDILADGRDQKITGEPCYDTVSVQVVDDRTTLETDKRNG